MRPISLFIVLAVVGCKGEAPQSASGQRHSGTELTAADGKRVFSELVLAKGGAKGVTLMFHQAGSNRHEYDPIAERVVALGWDCLKVDQRAGGGMWGATNETAAQFADSESYADAYQDMEAALEWAVEKGYKRIVAWGSSYSASLALRLAAEHATVGAVVSFSPGEYFDEKGVVAGWNARVKVPCFIAATSEELISGVYAIVDAKLKSAQREMDVVFGTVDGVHGSSALRKDRCPSANEQYWAELERFFRSYESGGKNFGG